LLDHAFAEIRGKDRAVCRKLVAVDFDDAGQDWSGPTAIVQDAGCFCEREAFVGALDEDFDRCCAGTGGEFFVFFRKLVPVVAFGCGRALGSVCVFLLFRNETMTFVDGCLCKERAGLLSESLKPSDDMLLMSASLRTAEL
jgi:hypothetical protein